MAPLALTALAFAPSAANAAVTTSKITAPAGPVFSMYDSTSADPSTQTFGIAGTSNGSGEGTQEGAGDRVDIRCYYVNDHERSWYDVVYNVPVDPSGSFSVTANLSDVGRYGTHSCVLRAVPAGANPGFLPDFAGPSMHVGRLNDKPSEGSNWWSVEQTQPKGRMHWRPASSCGLTSRPYSGGTDYASFYWAFRPWECAAAQNSDDGYGSSEIIVDGHFGYDPYQQRTMPATGAVDFAAWSSSVDPANGNLKIVESGQIMRCVDDSTPAKPVDSPYGTGCVSFVPTGVTRTRTIVQDHEGQVATVTDAWSSNDHAPHKVQLGYDNSSFSCGDESLGFGCQFGGIGFNAAKSSTSTRAASAEDTLATQSCIFEFYGSYFGLGYCAENPDPTKYKLPGETDYKTHDSGETIEGLATAPATIDVQVSDRLNDKAYGSLTYTSAPNGIVWRNGNQFTARYNRDVPADGAVTLTHIYGQARTASDIGVLGASAEDKQVGPAVTITSPANGSTVRTSTPTVTGTATDNIGVKTLTVNGQSVTPGSGGAYSAKVTLKSGSNTITAIAADAEGNTAQAQTVVIYKPAAAKKCKVPNVKGKSLANARAAIKKAGCVVGKVKVKTSKKVKPGRVITQGKKAGTRVAVATRVNLTIAKPKPAKHRANPRFAG